jgi:hypothetical protein
MNSRERLLTAFNHGIPDRIPWSGLITDYFINSYKNKYGETNPADFLKEAGADVVNWVGMKAKSKGVVVQTFANNILIDTDTSGDWLVEFYDYLGNIDYYKDKGVIVRKYITPLGELTAEFTFAPNSHTVFISKFPIKKIEDYKVFEYMIESLNYEDLSRYYTEKENELGQYGINAAVLHSTPVYELIQCFMGLESFYYFFFDYYKETAGLIDIIFSKFRECYNIYSNTVIPAVVIPEDASTTLYSPAFFDKYLKPAIKEYGKIIKDAGKVSILHACGHLEGLKKSLTELNVDCIESVSPPPTGNVSISEFKKSLPGVCIMGGIPANYYLLPEDDFKDYIKQLILDNKSGGNFILSSGDSVPSGAKLENIKAIPQLIEVYGKY